MRLPGKKVNNFLMQRIRFPLLRGNCRGFTLVELMIVVAIIGILAAVSIPVYMAYIQKSRIRTLVYPGLHVIETNISLYFASQSALPDASQLPKMMFEADTTYFHVGIQGNELVITIDSPENTSKLSRMHGMTMYMQPDTDGLKISTWALRGTLADYLGIKTEL